MDDAEAMCLISADAFVTLSGEQKDIELKKHPE
jgi:hypothetical protein